MTRISILVCLFVFSLSSLSAKDISSSKAKKFALTLQNLVKGERKEQIKELIEEMAKLDSKKLATYIPQAAVAVPSYANYRAALKFIARSKNPEVIETLAKMLVRSKADYRNSVVILEGFGYRKDEVSEKAITGQISNKISHIQVAAIKAGRKRRITSIVPNLIDVVEDHFKLRDREFLEAQLALIDLTGQDYDSAADWRKWWKTVEKSFDAKKVGKGKGRTAIDIKKPEDAVEFFGEEVFSRNLLFVIDTSGSMTSDGRIDRAKEQLQTAIKALKPGTIFNVIAFSSGVRTLQKTMEPATKKSIAKALKWVEGLSANGGTQTEEALRKAIKDLRVDTIILLTDGAPSPRQARATVRRPDPNAAIKSILKWFKDANSTRKIRVDTFGFGPGVVPGGNRGGGGQQTVDPFTKFLKDLAKMSGGKYQSID